MENRKLFHPWAFGLGGVDWGVKPKKKSVEVYTTVGFLLIWEPAALEKLGFLPASNRRWKSKRQTICMENKDMAF